VDVLAVERSDEGRLQLVADVVADAIARVLGVQQLAGDPLAIAVVAEELLEQAGCGQHVAGVFDEQVEELLFARDKREAHRGRPSTVQALDVVPLGTASASVRCILRPLGAPWNPQSRRVACARPVPG
jgi:hypothetical protein